MRDRQPAAIHELAWLLIAIGAGWIFVMILLLTVASGLNDIA